MSPAQPHCVAEQTVFGISPGTAKCRCGVPSSVQAWLWPGIVSCVSGPSDTKTVISVVRVWI